MSTPAVKKGQAVAYAPAEVQPGGATAVRAFVEQVLDSGRVDLLVDGQLVTGVPRCEDTDLWPQPGTWLP